MFVCTLKCWTERTRLGISVLFYVYINKVSEKEKGHTAPWPMTKMTPFSFFLVFTVSTSINAKKEEKKVNYVFQAKKIYLFQLQKAKMASI